MSESNLYNGRGTVSNSAINKRTTEKADMYDDLKSREAFNSAVRANLDRAGKEGYSRGANDVYRAVASPIVAGSPQDIQMQRNVDKGLSYRQQQEPGIVDDVSDYLNSLAAGAQDWLNGPAEASTQESSVPYSEFAQADKDNLRKYIQDSAIAQAKAEGDTSTENINRILIPKLEAEGL